MLPYVFRLTPSVKGQLCGIVAALRLLAVGWAVLCRVCERYCNSSVVNTGLMNRNLPATGARTGAIGQRTALHLSKSSHSRIVLQAFEAKGSCEWHDIYSQFREAHDLTS